MDNRLLSYDEKRLLVRGLELLEAEGGPGDFAEKVRGLKARLDDLCEPGAEDVCESTRIGTFW